MTAVAPTARTYELIAAIADRLALEIDEIVAAMDAAVIEVVPEFGADAAIAAEVTATNRGNWQRFLAVARQAQSPLSDAVPPEALDAARTVVRRGIDLDRIYEGYRRGHQVGLERWLACAYEIVEPGPELIGVTELSLSLAFRFIDQTLGRVLAEAQREREDGHRRCARASHRDHPIDPRRRPDRPHRGEPPPRLRAGPPAYRGRGVGGVGRRAPRRARVGCGAARPGRGIPTAPYPSRRERRRCGRGSAPPANRLSRNFARRWGDHPTMCVPSWVRPAGASKGFAPPTRPRRRCIGCCWATQRAVGSAPIGNLRSRHSRRTIPDGAARVRRGHSRPACRGQHRGGPAARNAACLP